MSSTRSHRWNNACANAPLPRGSVTMGHPYFLRQCQHQQNLLAVLLQGIFEHSSAWVIAAFLTRLFPAIWVRIGCSVREEISPSGAESPGTVVKNSRRAGRWIYRQYSLELTRCGIRQGDQENSQYYQSWWEALVYEFLRFVKRVPEMGKARTIGEK